MKTTRLQIEASGPQACGKTATLAHLKKFLENSGWTVQHATTHEGGPANPNVLIAEKDLTPAELKTMVNA